MHYDYIDLERTGEGTGRYPLAVGDKVEVITVDDDQVLTIRKITDDSISGGGNEIQIEDIRTIRILKLRPGCPY